MEEIGTPSTVPIMKLSQTIFLHYFECKWHFTSYNKTLAIFFIPKWERKCKVNSPHFPAWIASMNLHEFCILKILFQTATLEANYPPYLLQGKQAINERTCSKPEIKTNQGNSLRMKVKSLYFFFHFCSTFCIFSMMVS